MGFTPCEIDQMSLWEFGACTDGYAKAHGGKSGPSSDEMSDERAAELGIEGFDGN